MCGARVDIPRKAFMISGALKDGQLRAKNIKSKMGRIKRPFFEND